MKASRPARAEVAVVLTCLAAAFCFGGVVTLPGLALSVLPSVLVIGAVVARLVRRRRPLAGLATGLALGLALAEVANVISGDSHGPVARSTALAALCTAGAIAALSRTPALFLLPVAVLVRLRHGPRRGC